MYKTKYQKKGGNLQNEKKKLENIFMSKDPYTDDEINTITKLITDNPNLIDLKYKCGYTVDQNFYTAFERKTLLTTHLTKNKLPWLLNENMIPLILLMLSLTKCEFDWVSVYIYIEFLFTNTVWINCSYEKLLSVLKKYLDRLDECGIDYEKAKKKDHLVKLLYSVIYSGLYGSKNDQLNENTKIDYVCKMIDIFFSTDMSLANDRDLQTRFLVNNDIYFKKLRDYGCNVKKLSNIQNNNGNNNNYNSNNNNYNNWNNKYNYTGNNRDSNNSRNNSINSNTLNDLTSMYLLLAKNKYPLSKKNILLLFHPDKLPNNIKLIANNSPNVNRFVNNVFSDMLNISIINDESILNSLLVKNKDNFKNGGNPGVKYKLYKGKKYPIKNGIRNGQYILVRGKKIYAS